MKFMGRELTTNDGETYRSNWKVYPLITFSRDVMNRWFGMLHCEQRGTDLKVLHKPTLRAAKTALAKQVRALRAELETLK